MTTNNPTSSPDDDSELKRSESEHVGGREDQQRSSDRKDRSSALRFAGLGIELATTTLVFTGIGYLIDWWWQVDKSYATAGGTLVGFTIGMIRFVQQASQGNRRTK